MIRARSCIRGLARTTLVSAAIAAASASFAQQPSIVGTWQWTRKSNNCSEQHVYRDDGTGSVQSGARQSDRTYRMSWAPEPNGRYKLTTTIVKDGAGPDCAGATEDRVGKARVVYVLFGQSGETMLQCDSPAGPDCIGPLKRVAP
jgi:hypothetical protein